MERVAGPLREAGADIRCTEGRLPCTILSRPAGGFSYTLPVASAQVKSALLMAGLFGPETWRVTEPVPSRDHTERMLSDMGAAIERKGDTWVLTGGRELRPLHLTVPGDVSSAVFLLCAALVCPGSRVTVRDVLLNPTRAAIVDVLGEMGADIQVRRTEDLPEPRGDLTARHSSLRGVRIGGRRIPLLIDELPALAAAGMFAEGDTVVRDAAELRVKESDRIRSVVHMVHSFGGRAEELEDGFVVHGAAGERARLHPADADSRGDHRIAMAAAVAACAVRGDSRIEGAEAASVSYPEFYSVLENLASGSG
jgi:3-phosphoshikimate 1-carboxyvinyltransferase